MRQKKSLSFTVVILILFLLSAGGAILWSFLIPDFSSVWVFALPFLLAGRGLAALFPCREQRETSRRGCSICFSPFSLLSCGADTEQSNAIKNSLCRPQEQTFFSFFCPCTVSFSGTAR